MDDEPVPERFRAALGEVVDRIAAADFDGLVRDGIYARGGDLGHWIREYGDHGATILALPDEAWESASAIKIDGRPGEWSVVIDLWSQEEGRSDLSMEAIVIESEMGLGIEIENIHVM